MIIYILKSLLSNLNSTKETHTYNDKYAQHKRMSQLHYDFR